MSDKISITLMMSLKKILTWICFSGGFSFHQGTEISS